MKTKTFLAALLIVVGSVASMTGRASAASQPDIQASLDRGIAWLVQQQNANGAWQQWDQPVAHTAFAVAELEDRAFELGYDPFDPAYQHSENVIAGLNYIFGQSAISPCDADSVVFQLGNSEVYSSGIAMMAIAASKAPDRVVDAPGSVVDGWTYRQVLEANVGYFACSQITDGGWRYEYGEEWSDNSATGYAVLGLAYAESPVYGFDLGIPDLLKSNLSGWIDINQISGDTPHDGGSGYGASDDTSNLLRAGNLVFEMAFVGDTQDTIRMQRALDYLGRAWNDPDWSWWDIHSYPGWYGNPDWHGSPVHQDDPPDWWQGLDERWSGWQGPHYQAMYCMMKGLAYAGADTILVDGVDVDWFASFADRILETQMEDGSWARDYWGSQTTATEWALLTLERASPARNVPIDVKPSSCPNPLGVKDKGVLPVAILGTEGIDVTRIDPSTVELEGVAPLRWRVEDVSTPYAPWTGKQVAYDCNEYGSDGFPDLTLKFSAQEVIAVLGPVSIGQVLVLELAGDLKAEFGGARFFGEDVVRIVGK